MQNKYFLLFVVICIATHTAASSLHALKDRSQQLLDSIGLRVNHVNPLRPIRNGVPDYTDIDRSFRQLLLIFRGIFLGSALNGVEALYRSSMHEGKLQDPIPKHVPFPCPLNNTRSTSTPISVERLRPGDIDIVAAIGDSLSAGNGIISRSVIDVLNEFRGFSFSSGGLGTWRTALTLPNILKVFNPKLYGYATGHSLVANHETSHFSIAEPMIMSHDLLYQARVIIDLMQRDPHVDMKRHWKLLTVFVGNNDLCSDICHWDDPQKLIDRHAQDLRQAFRLLRDNVPRLLINLVAVPNILLAVRHIKVVPIQCFLVYRVACNCLLSDRLTAADMKQRYNIIRRWQQVDLEVARLAEFHRMDFAIIAHPGITNLTTPLLPNGNTDWRYFSHDCFHFSQRSHAAGANLLWNSMFLPDEQKPRPIKLPEPFERFMCPSNEQPFFVVRPS
ncbi:phospholipase B1, membrane-associated-like [Drosophila hydei]|uniref:Phospholipase B1, membrane-associated n=1 Tax=Drosophila hydei TaxID=7224 RepID=A0A6J1M2F3_DROHY|nr:phospholipase B1, membrane-associated-like [Drosophila hydei]